MLLILHAVIFPFCQFSLINHMRISFQGCLFIETQYKFPAWWFSHCTIIIQGHHIDSGLCLHCHSYCWADREIMLRPVVRRYLVWLSNLTEQKLKHSMVFQPPASQGCHGLHTVSALKSPVEQFCQLCDVGVGNDMLTTDVSNESWQANTGAQLCLLISLDMAWFE